ncbi:hypothetical protein DES39_0362 [Orbus hercynius]|uniref:CAP-Gly protein n=1 Tax=Orbus hercynius TaxID=593135 RepID=A0A495RI01_9GAMM|nr:CAP-Gly protein [Orbus hercynius]RKS87147.1 hypothetical protein DES39_0362 [Orbus hercynius]
MVVECKKISWGSIIAGLFTVIAVSMLLSLLGASMGLAMIEPKSNDPFSGIGTAFIIWTVISFIISLFLGGYVAGRLAANTGLIHGFLVWATTLVVYSIFSAVLGIGMAKMAGSVISTTGSAVGNIASNTGSIIGHSANRAGDAIKDIFSNVEINTDINKIDVKDNINTVLKQTGIDTLQPDYLQNQLTQSSKDIHNAVKSIAMNPNDADQILSNLDKQLKKRVDNLTADTNKDSIIEAIEKNTDMNKQEATKVVDNYLTARKNIQDTVKNRLNDAEQALEKAKTDYNQLKEQAKEKADQIASQTAKLTLWAFFAFLLGAVLSAFGGCLGVRHSSCLLK